MSRLIKFTEEHESLIEEMCEKMRNTKMIGGEFKFTYKLPEIDRTAYVIFTTEAYAKMLSIIMAYDSEVGWYCTVERAGELDDDIYLVTDVLVFPQIVTGTTVDSDDEKRIEWFNELPDEVLTNIRGDFHSHVNMGVSPSGTDDREVDAVLKNLEDDMFRIFMIWNKKLEYSARIFDMKKNIFFGTKDVVVDVLGVEMNKFLRESKEMVNKKSYSVVTTSTTATKKDSAVKKEEKKTPEKKASKKWESKRDDIDIDDLYNDDGFLDPHGDDYYYDYEGYGRRGKYSGYSGYGGYYYPGY